jgi:formamidase
MDQVHNLSGPIEIADAKGELAHPGDLLMVEICNLGPLPGDEWGFTGTFDRENGGAMLFCTEVVMKAAWDMLIFCNQKS